eukprot:CAMPEP_0185158182 /NCGR_PEP_ID=MMETSP1139-20130426/2250_1 /TAXON_ID=298111 /ORGANISM="Pavlova sp., Strain CCMP459" /LENGTH=129 /DNA_ID=CAMNT_0027723307 /DNA_START=336 /DNA_END=729 /DNA_ORIENTATION=+
MIRLCVLRAAAGRRFCLRDRRLFAVLKAVIGHDPVRLRERAIRVERDHIKYHTGVESKTHWTVGALLGIVGDEGCARSIGFTFCPGIRFQVANHCALDMSRAAGARGSQSGGRRPTPISTVRHSRVMGV